MFVRLTEKQIDKKIDFIENYIKAENAATASTVDANANVSSKNIATLSNEINKDINIQINRRLLYKKICSLFGKEDADKYIEQLEKHEIYTNDESSLLPYCTSITMYPFLVDGLAKLGGESVAPKHLESFCGSFVNLVFAISSQFAGAVATVEFLMYFDYFAKKAFGEDYINTDAKYIENQLQSVVYALNQPAAARGYQAVFWNISVFDKYYFESLFGEFVFPDLTSPEWESVSKLQKFFLKWINEERKKAVLTFPVVTAAVLSENKEVKDKEFENFLCETLSEGNSFFVYMSDSVDSLASCCFDGGQEVLVKSSTGGVERVAIEEWHNTKWEFKKNPRVFHNGCWADGKLNKIPRAGRKMYRVETVNNKVLVMTEDHLNPTLRGDVFAKDLVEGDYLMFNSSQVDAIPEDNLKLSYEDGLLIGAYLGDGSKHRREDCDSVETTLSLNLDKVSDLSSMLANWNIYESKNNVVFAKTASKDVAEFIDRWVSGKYAQEKRLNLNVLLQSIEFRKGILDGYYKTDGGNSNRIYTTSEGLTKDIEAMLVSMGKQCVINVEDRTDEPVVIRGEVFKRNYPLYCIRFYGDSNKRVMKDIYVKHMGNIYFKVKSVTEVLDYDKEFVYCFEMKQQSEPYFTLPNGVVTHNCRLRNEFSDNTFSYSLGAGGVATGSINVITLNLNRLVQNGTDLSWQIKQLHKYQVAYREIMNEFKAAGILTAYDAGFIDLDKQFLTIGLNGIVEAAESQGIKANNTPEYKEFVTNILQTIYQENRKATQQYGYKFNTEFVPAENLGVKNAQWDRKDKLIVGRDCYNSYFYPVEDGSIGAIEKFVLHGEDFVKYLDGGSALHLNLDHHPTKEGYKNLFKLASLSGCNYFTTNVKSTICNSCGKIDKDTFTSCPSCGSEDIDYGTRVIGYLKRVSSFSKARQEEESRRHYLAK